MAGPLIAAAALTAAGAAWAVRGKSSRVFGPSVWRGPADAPALALTFDDGPSPQTGALLRELDRFGVPATFFVCGKHVRRQPGRAREIANAGHELGNHTDSHARLWARSPGAIRDEIRRAQESIAEAAGAAPRLFRPTYGVRWFGLAAALREFGLTEVMWTVIGRDWALPGGRVAARLLRGARNGAIFCLHDGREHAPEPDIAPTIEAVRLAVPPLLDSGYRFLTVSALIGYSGAVCPKTSSSG